MRRASTVTSLGWILLAAIGPAIAADPLPYTIEVEASFGPALGPGQMIEEVRLELLSALDRARCFRRVDAAGERDPGDADLRLRVTLDDLVERTEVETSLAARNDPDAPPDVARQMVSSIEVLVTAEIFLADAPAVVRSRRFHQSNAWRPVLNEDPRYEARSLMIDQVIKTVRSFACKGSAKKWSKQVARARAASGTPRAPASR